MTQNNLAPESPAVIAHLAMTQDIIRRMAGNCRSIKVWCIAL